MITEDFVSFETAKLLKEKGFDEPCLMCYNSDKKIDNYGLYRSYKNSDVFALTAPTLQMVMKWLREKKKLYINTFADSKDAERNDFSIIYRTLVFNGKSSFGLCEFPTYEKACEAAIKYCLENLV